jgi:hypothetical protein
MAQLGPAIQAEKVKEAAAEKKVTEHGAFGRQTELRSYGKGGRKDLPFVNCLQDCHRTH